MTIEEAIKGLKNVSTMFTGYKPNEEMFAMAIESLEWQEEFMNKVYEQNQEAEFYINGRRFRVREVPQ